MYLQPKALPCHCSISSINELCGDLSGWLTAARKMKIQDEGDPEPVPSTTEAHADYETNHSYVHSMT
jgi:hypothetical protein